MIDSKLFIKQLIKNDICFFSGVPDSLFKDLCWEFENNFKKNHIIAANEGSSIGIGIGYNLATNKIPLIYLQNSGLGNTVNPLISMADTKVYQIPMFMIIGWRGEISSKKQIKDEPQHKKQGLITENLLKVLGIKYKILNYNSDYKKIIGDLKNYSKKYSKPVALLVRKNVFDNSKKRKSLNSKGISREESLKLIDKLIPKNSIKITTTGMISREFYEINLVKKKFNDTFMSVGGMGHTISIAAGISFVKKRKKIFCFDGDGSFLMHLGASATSAKLNNIIHIVLNNKSHDSVGGHEVCSPDLKLSKLAKNLGYKFTFTAKNSNEIKKIFKKINKIKKSIFIEIICRQGNRKNLMRPKGNINNYKKKFKEFVY